MSMLGDLPLPWPVEINLSKSAMERIIYDLRGCKMPHAPSVECEVDNFRNLLQNLLDRLEPEPGNFDLIGG